jgi:tetratricopeptide (TPR) repeat protein
MIRRFQLFLGPARTRALIVLLGSTGLLSLMLNVIVKEYDWVRPVQSIIVLVFVVGAAIIIGGRMDSEERRRWLAILLPAIGAVLIGVLFVPQLLTALVGAGLGWIVAGLFIFRPHGRMEYQKAVKHLRRGEYGDAVKAMDELINIEPDEPNHYRFRAELLRIWGKLGPAKRDYKKMIELAPDSAVAHNGLAEVCLQSGEYQAARQSALRAYELAPDEWVTAYNLGMIEDRLGESQAAVEHLRKALERRVPDVRHRLLIHFYLARAYSRLSDAAAAQAEIAALKKDKNGLEEWQKLLEAEEAATLRAVIAEDVQAAEDLIDGKLDVSTLAGEDQA